MRYLVSLLDHDSIVKWREEHLFVNPKWNIKKTIFQINCALPFKMNLVINKY